MKIKFDVTPTEFIIIKDILKKYLTKDCKAYVFGSRAKSSSLHGSDLDLALECKEKIDFKKLSKIKIDFEDSRLPYMVDVIDLQAIKEYFKNMIEKEMIEFPLGKLERVPELRFKEFSGEWEEKRLGNITSKIGSGKTPKGGDRVYLQSGISFIRSQNVINDKLVLDNICISEDTHLEMKNSKVIANDILLNITGGSIGRSCIVPDDFLEGNVNQHVSIIRLKKDIPKFVQSLLSSWRGQKLIFQGQTGSGREGINFESIKNFKIYLPSKQEQKKIASFLTTVDKKIDQLTKKVELQEQYKKGVMQKIFKQEIRFKNDDGSEFEEWEEKKFKDVFERIIRKNKENNLNVLTISAQQGLVNQEEYFNKSVSAKDVTGYYLLHKDDFAYNKSYSNGYPMGAIKRLMRYDKGVVSTLYICFKSKIDNINFLEHYFNSGLWNKEVHKIAQEGARNHGLLNISVIEFFNDIKINIPCLQEQTKIANFLSSLDKKIDSTKEQLAKTKEFKKGLLQRMFV